MKGWLHSLAPAALVLLSFRPYSVSASRPTTESDAIKTVIISLHVGSNKTIVHIPVIWQDGSLQSTVCRAGSCCVILLRLLFCPVSEWDSSEVVEMAAISGAAAMLSSPSSLSRPFSLAGLFGSACCFGAMLKVPASQV